VAVALAFASPALADPYPTPIKVSAGPLSRTLQEIARQSGGELLFDHNLVAGLQARKIDANTAVQAALAGTKLSVRRVASGALIIEPPSAPPLARQDVAVSEVLVVGHRTQNADIRRHETDIQPYHVITGDQITAAHVDTIGQYFDTHVATDSFLRLAGTSQFSEGNSQIDLRGLGTDETLVLIDGRRMPGFAFSSYSPFPHGASATLSGFTQADLNALPLHGVDRIETLTGSAGGIYGYGALGGVVNVVLAHDRPGAELNMTTGVSSRGDAGRVSLEGRVEFSPDHGATEVTLDGGLSRSQPLTAGQRDYLAKDRQETYRNDPSDFLTFFQPNGNSIAAFDLFSTENLVLKPEYGGAALGSPFTLLPTGFEGTAKDLGAALASRAGQLDLGLSKGEAASTIIPSSELGSLLMNVRHEFGGGFEAYFDGIMLWNHSRTVDHSVLSELLMFDSPNDPFEQDVLVSFPATHATFDTETRFNSSRFTLGVVAPLPFGWRGTAEATWGGAVYSQRLRTQYEDPFAILLDDSLNPFGSWSQFQTALQSYRVSGSTAFAARTRFLEQSLRLAGPVFQTPGGTATVTVLVEHRDESIPSYGVVAVGDDPQQPTGVVPVPSLSMGTISAYAELRAPIFADRAPLPLLRGLEVQLAVRGDSQSDAFSIDPTQPGSPRAHLTFTGASYTVGAKATPLSWLMLRGSFATSENPPPPEDLVEESSFDITFDDPKRVGDLDFFDTKNAGSPNLKNVLATTASVGFVLTPFGPRGPQFSLDYSHIHKTHDFLLLSDVTVIAHEDYWPQRVQRGPLTDEDRALGYTAGPITLVDATAINGGSLDAQSLDARLDWSFALPVGWLHLYGAATYNFELVDRGLFSDDERWDGYAGGPLTWRANGGVDWSLGSWTIGANAQYYSSYKVNLYSGDTSTIEQMLQGADTIPAQAYLDLHIRKRVHLHDTDFRIDFGVSNVLDSAAPRETSFLGVLGTGVSDYGDLRRRRFELSVSALF
jgi:iron complex outermembrane receptor protein